MTVSYEPHFMAVNPRLAHRRTDINEVGYYLAADPKNPGLNYLMRRQDTGYDDKPEEGGSSDALLHNVVDLRFEFWLRNDWVDKWDSKEASRIPSAVKTIIKLKNYRGNEETFTMLSFLLAGMGERQ
ncbi:MAG TPA: hypothetical protein ENN21_00260 [Spirochaetes bacterium]|nr:hypothetical protein [Spirochaetota bacterium]